MTGYHPDFDFLERLGVHFDGEDRRPVCDAQTLESNVAWHLPRRRNRCRLPHQ